MSLPIAIFCPPVVVANRAFTPIPTLSLAVVLPDKLAFPTATFLVPVVLASSEY